MFSIPFILPLISFDLPSVFPFLSSELHSESQNKFCRVPCIYRHVQLCISTTLSGNQKSITTTSQNRYWIFLSHFEHRNICGKVHRGSARATVVVTLPLSTAPLHAHVSIFTFTSIFIFQIRYSLICSCKVVFSPRVQ